MTPRNRIFTRIALMLICAAVLYGCSGSSTEAERVELPVQSAELDSKTVTTASGWSVELQTFRTSISDITFTTDGEEHVESNALLEFFISDARAHPGHEAGGEVIGALPGRHLVDWTASARDLGEAEFIAGEYTGANFRYTRAAAGDGLAEDDALLGHSVVVEAVARRDGNEVSFRAIIDQDEDRRVIGLPFTAELDVQSAGIVTLHAHPAAPQGGRTIFDGIDFESLVDEPEPVVFEPGTEPYNRLRRALQVHDHFSASYGE